MGGFCYFAGNPPSTENVEGPYPIVVSQTGVNKGLVVQDYAFGKYLGYINLNFSSDGVVTKYSGNPILLDSSVEEGKYNNRRYSLNIVLYDV